MVKRMSWIPLCAQATKTHRKEVFTRGKVTVVSHGLDFIDDAMMMKWCDPSDR